MAKMIIRRDLSAERAGMSVYRAAMRKSLAMLPIGNRTALEIADEIASAPETPPLAKIAWADVTVFERSNPDIQVWAPALVAMFTPGADTDLVVDAIFRLAMAVEANDAAGQAAMIAALQSAIS